MVTAWVSANTFAQRCMDRSLSKAVHPKLERHRWALSFLVRVHREFIYLWLLAAGIWAASLHDSMKQTETTTTTGQFLMAKQVSVRPSFDANRLEDLDHLVLVAGHAVLDPHTESLERADQRDGVWYLMDYQRNQDMPTLLVSHIKRGVEEAAADPRALLVFSGGQTRPEAGPTDEGLSYYRVAEHYGWWGLDSQKTASDLPVVQRTVTEEYATDSFQNLLFSICRFHEVVGKYPARITVVGFSFKRHRFVSLHRTALRFPLHRFRYVGLDPPRNSHFDLQTAKQGEKRNSIRPFQADPYGCNSTELLQKRRTRNPFKRTNPYPLSCPGLHALLEWCAPQTFPYALPWAEAVEISK